MNTTPYFKPLFLLALMLMGAGHLQAAPANDNFVDRAELLTGPAVDTVNTGATLEANEPLPPGYTTETYHASLWWQWRPLISGWYEVTTAGSGIANVLSVWNSAANTLSVAPALVHANRGNGHTSRIQFFADNRITYKIAVAGSSAADQGDIRLQVSSMPDPFARVISARFDHAVVDVTSAEAVVTATLTLQASREIQDGLLTLYTPDGLILLSVPFSAANRVRGHVALGDYEVSFSMPRYIAAGTYGWGIQFLNQSVNVEASQGKGAISPLDAGLVSSLQVSNGGVVDAFGQWVTRELAQGSDPSGLTLDRFAFGLARGNDGVSQFMSLTGGTLAKTGLPSITSYTEAGGAKRLRVHFVRRLNAALQGLHYVVQFSNDLQNWETAATIPKRVAADSSFEAMEVIDTLTVDDEPRRFARVLVQKALQ